MLSACIESLTNGLPEIVPLLQEHWEFLALYKDRMPLDPQFDAYLARDAEGQIVYAALRNDGELVGYMICFVTRGLHYQSTLTATMDLIWVRPPYRGERGGDRLLNAMKAELKRRGVQLWWVGSKNHAPIEWLFKAHGFTHEESYFAQWIGEN